MAVTETVGMNAHELNPVEAAVQNAAGFVESNENYKVEVPVAEAEEKKPEPSALEKFWKAVRDNPSDFTGWTYLLQYVEQQNEPESAREAFDAFLARYPYCYGYWKKYADMETKNDNMDEAEKVFEKGLMAIPLSIDLWLHFLNFETKKYEEHPEKFAILRALYERAITAAGTDFRSDKLWDSYIEWEMELGNNVSVTALFDRVLAVPTHLYSQHFEKFTKHVESHNPKDILTLDEFLRLRQEVITKLEEEKKKTMEASVEEASMDPTDPEASPPGEDAPPGEEAPPGAVTDAKVDEEEIKALRERMLETRRMVHKVTEEEVSKRWSYEEGIRRPYFHVKPLEKGQLKNWKEYLDFEIENGSHERVMVLFERCMIACALYEEFWLKYAKYMEKHNTEIVRNIFKRACNIHLPRKATIHLEWAAFEERKGDFETAAQVLDNVELIVPGLAMVQCRRIGLRRRQGHFKEAQDLYQKCVDEAEDVSVGSFYSIKYARYLSKVLGNVEKARQILEAALEKDKDNHKLYLQLIDVEYGKSNISEAVMVELFDRCLKSDLELEHRVAFSQRKLEFLEDFGSTADRLLEAYDEHQKLVKELQAAKKKRKEGDSEDEPASKKAKRENGAAGDTTAVSTQQTQSSNAQQGQHDSSNAYNYYGQQWGGHYGGWGGYGQGGWGYGSGGWGQNY